MKSYDSRLTNLARLDTRNDVLDLLGLVVAVVLGIGCMYTLTTRGQWSPLKLVPNKSSRYAKNVSLSERLSFSSEDWFIKLPLRAIIGKEFAPVLAEYLTRLRVRVYRIAFWAS